METLQDILKRTIDELNNLLLKTLNPEEEKAIREKRDTCFRSWEALVGNNLNERLPDVTAAIDALKATLISIKDAQDDLKKVANVITDVGIAAQVVDKIAAAVIKYVM